jgi:hypothetical protein
MVHARARTRCRKSRPPARHGTRIAGIIGQVFGQGLGLGSAAGAYAAVSLHCLAGEILVAAATAILLATGVILISITVFGSAESSDRVFRILRWIRNKEEPPAPHP